MGHWKEMRSGRLGPQGSAGRDRSWCSPRNSEGSVRGGGARTSLLPPLEAPSRWSAGVPLCPVPGAGLLSRRRLQAAPGEGRPSKRSPRAGQGAPGAGQRSFLLQVTGDHQEASLLKTGKRATTFQAAGTALGRPAKDSARAAAQSPRPVGAAEGSCGGRGVCPVPTEQQGAPPG